jgi:hypothetical protein
MAYKMTYHGQAKNELMVGKVLEEKRLSPEAQAKVGKMKDIREVWDVK